MGDEPAYEPAVGLDGVSAGCESREERHEPDSDDVIPSPGSNPESIGPQPGHRAYRENQRGVSYDSLLGDYLDGAADIRIVDPYVRTFHQCRNLMEVLETALKHFDYSVPELQVHLVTCPDEHGTDRQVDYLQQIADAVAPMGMRFTWEFDEEGVIHARHVYVDGRWDIMLDRGLDIWQKFDSGNAFAIESRVQEMRRVRQFEITYMERS